MKKVLNLKPPLSAAERAKRYYRINREKVKEKAKLQYKLHGPKKRKSKNDYRKRFPEAHKELARKCRFKRRMEMLQAYGGKCVCCGETKFEFLSIDHKNGGGAEHRRNLGTLHGLSIVNFLRKNKWPKKDFQLLCMNCNWAKGKYGYCPHTKKKRPSLKIYLLSIAKTVSTRSTCPDLNVGCVIATKDGHILSTGYNGAPAGEKHCRNLKGKCLDNNENHAVVHAEQNCVSQAAREGISLKNTFAYVTHPPCQKCRMLLKQAGIERIIVK